MTWIDVMFCFGSDDWFDCADKEPLCEKFEKCKEKWSRTSFDWMKAEDVNKSGVS